MSHLPWLTPQITLAWTVLEAGSALSAGRIDVSGPPHPPPPRCPFQARRCQQAAGMEHHNWGVRGDLAVVPVLLFYSPERCRGVPGATQKGPAE